MRKKQPNPSGGKKPWAKKPNPTVGGTNIAPPVSATEAQAHLASAALLTPRPPNVNAAVQYLFLPGGFFLAPGQL